MTEIDEVFPTCMRAGGHEHWFAWAMPDDGDCLQSHQGRVICAADEAALRKMLDQAMPDIAVGECSHLDLDAALAELRQGRVTDVEAIIDIWNLLTDLFRALGAGPRQMFFPNYLDSYDAFFSCCVVAEMVEMAPQSIDPDDIANVVEVFEAGRAMVIAREGDHTEAARLERGM
ncbi:hypothetical protein [Stenotrophomonas sp.]|uniref:hypothetical protein n=1 Tax=Stenotrophomonas sp. TaxID=69392 RepID=UPI0028B05E05|nr:hypothetical protein [Stenotrophomonas sp.]